ncbi:MAG: C45 family autoproteolytic acyltransferase/hydrolase [Candidatus Latescibacterota bacterium]|jgi:isopenicillin-N N-acyltransferase-like protein
MPGRYRELEVAGTPLEIGQQIGEIAREEVCGFAAIALERVNKTVAISRASALEIARQSAAHVEHYAPHMLDELRGMAQSSGVSFDNLMLLQVRNQLQPTEDAGCTSFAGDAAIVAQNWDNDPALDPFTLVLTRRPTGKPALMNITQAGLIAYIGLNSAGIALCLNSLPAPSRTWGVPHYFTVRAIYESTSIDEAIQAVRRAQRAIPANIMLATPQGPADMEITIDDVHVLRDEDLVTHTNHCLHPDLKHINPDFPELIESGPRLDRINHILGSVPLTVARAKAALRDHDNHPRSICRHANDHPATGFWVSVFSVVIEAAAGRMHVSRGNPCENEYETYQLS